jgi:hypothetical protein
MTSLSPIPPNPVTTHSDGDLFQSTLFFSGQGSWGVGNQSKDNQSRQKMGGREKSRTKFVPGYGLRYGNSKKGEGEKDDQTAN